MRSFGCSANQADGEVLAGCLAMAGYKLADSESSADIVIYNTCAVKGPTENRVVEALKRIPDSKKLVVAGCLPSINFERLTHEIRFDGVIGAAPAERIIEVVRAVERGERVNMLQSTAYDLPKLTLPCMRSSSVVSIIPISYGCLGSCAYCCVVLARGRLRSYGITEIVHRMRADLKQGFQEFWLTSQDVGCYGRDKGTNIAKLLMALCALEGDFKIRVGMMTVNMVVDVLEELLHAFEDEHVFKFLHLPVQSGDDNVLRSMRRFYSVRDFNEVVDAFRRRLSKVTLATDVICGFPGENETAFRSTMQLLEQAKPDIVNVSKFFARPNTAASSRDMKDLSVPLAEIKNRSTRAAALAKKIATENNRRWVGWEGGILIDEKGKTPDSWVGRNYAYKPVTIKTEKDMLGKTLSIRVTEAFSTYLEGRQI